MQPLINKYTPEKEYYFQEGCEILELSNSCDDEQVSIARARVKPGKTTRWHCVKDTTERYMILEGQGLAEVGNITEEMTSGDVIVIPPDCRQRITNTGNSDLIFLAICSPRFSLKNYQDLETDITKGR